MQPNVWALGFSFFSEGCSGNAAQTNQMVLLVVTQCPTKLELITCSILWAPLDAPPDTFSFFQVAESLFALVDYFGTHIRRF